MSKITVEVTERAEGKVLELGLPPDVVADLIAQGGLAEFRSPDPEIEIIGVHGELRALQRVILKPFLEPDES